MFTLASRSPRRSRLLREAGYEFRVEPSGASEEVETADPVEHARQTALKKARAVWRGEGIVLAADTVVSLDGAILGKPKDEEEAKRMLEELSGRRHDVITAVALLWEGGERVEHETTCVEFRELSETEISSYVAGGEPMDKAGAYAVQGEGRGLVSSLDGSFTNVVGLPIELTARMLAEAGASKDF